MNYERSSAIDAQIKKGVLEMCVLHLIRETPTYGYDVMKTVRQYLPEVNESTVYAILRRLHSEGCADITLGGGSGGPPRKYYRITDNGVDLLERNIASWHRVNNALTQMGL